MKILKWNLKTKAKEWCHPTFISARDLLRELHYHDFCEVFITLHSGIIHNINGKRESLPIHTIMLIRPSDTHSFEVPKSIPDNQTVMFNMTLRPEIIADMSIRLFADEPNFWSGAGAYPFSFIPTDEEAEQLLSDARKLMYSKWNRFAAERFLLNLIHVLESRKLSHDSVMPTWLQHACAKINEPNNLRKGLDRFYELCGRSREHISRELKRHTGVSPVELLAKDRTDYAASLLQSTSMELHDIAAECGFQNLSYFFATFKKYYGTTPRKYRVSSKSNLT
jgi:AraC family cel operon transcriptional repressor